MEDKKQKMQELYMEYQMIEQHTKQMQQQLEMITQQIMEVVSTSRSIDELENVKEGKEILVPVNSGIFAKARISDTSELAINVGANVVVTKSLKSAKELVDRQAVEMRKVQKKIVDELEKLAARASHIENELKKPQE